MDVPSRLPWRQRTGATSAPTSTDGGRSGSACGTRFHVAGIIDGATAEPWRTTLSGADPEVERARQPWPKATYDQRETVVRATQGTGAGDKALKHSRPRRCYAGKQHFFFLRLKRRQPHSIDQWPLLTGHLWQVAGTGPGRRRHFPRDGGGCHRCRGPQNSSATCSMQSNPSHRGRQPLSLCPPWTLGVFTSAMPLPSAPPP